MEAAPDRESSSSHCLHLNPAHQQGAHYWYDTANTPPMGAPVNLNHKDTVGLIGVCSSWTVPNAVLEQELRRQSVRRFRCRRFS